MQKTKIQHVIVAQSKPPKSKTFQERSQIVFLAKPRIFNIALKSP